MGYIGLINSPKTESIQSIQQILSTFASFSLALYIF